MKEGGRFVVSVPFGDNPEQSYSPSVLTHYGIAHRRYLHGAFPESYLRSLLVEAGFRDIVLSVPFSFQLVAVCAK